MSCTSACSEQHTYTSECEQGWVKGPCCPLGTIHIMGPECDLYPKAKEPKMDEKKVRPATDKAKTWAEIDPNWDVPALEELQRPDYFDFGDGHGITPSGPWVVLAHNGPNYTCGELLGPVDGDWIQIRRHIDMGEDPSVVIMGLTAVDTMLPAKDMRIYSIEGWAEDEPEEGEIHLEGFPTRKADK